MSIHTSSTLCLLALCAQSLCAQIVLHPDTAELSLAGLHGEVESTDVIRVLGRPDSVRTYEHLNDIGAAYERFFYRNVIVFMGPDGGEDGVKLIAPGLATRRGLAVGDSVARALELYGAPDARDETELRWSVAPRDPRDHRQLVVEVRRGRVTSIYAGFVYPTGFLRLAPRKRVAACSPSQASVGLRSVREVASEKGTARLTPSRDSGAAFDVSITMHGLPAAATLGSYSTYVVWVATPTLDDFRNLGPIENEKTIAARVTYPQMVFLVSAEPDVTGSRWLGPILLAGRC